MRTGLLLAADDARDPAAFFESTREHLLHGATPEATIALIAGFVGLVVLIVLLSRLFRAPEAIAPLPRSDMLKEAAEVLKLTAGERRDIALLAHRSGATQPAAVLLSPANLAHALAVATSASPDLRLANHIDALCQKLHGVPLPAASG